MEIKMEVNGNEGAFVAMDGDTRAGMMTYSITSSEMIIVDHTEVESAYRGQNIGMQLLNAVVDYARKNGIKIIPLCPFVNSVFKKKEDLRDVLQ